MRDCVCRPDKVHLYCDTIIPLNRAHSELSPEYLDTFWLRAQPKNFNSYGATPNEFVAHNSVDDGPFRGHFCRPRRPRRLLLACRPYPCMRTAPPDRRRPSEGMDGGVEAAGMGDDRRRGKITLERPQGVLKLRIRP